MKSGYIIANQDEEFVVSMVVGEDYECISWGKWPGQAMVFSTRKACRKAMKAIKGRGHRLFELMLMETDSRFVVGCSGGVVPPWLKA